MAGGGTGGHVVPALAVARELRARGHQVIFVGVRRGMEAKLVPAEGFPIEWIEIAGLNRVGARRMLSTLLELPSSILQARRILARYRPAAIFSMGGYVAGPVLLAALTKRIPIVVMEPNAVPGFTHRRLARWVSRALLSFPATARWFPPDRSEVTGMPVREEFFQTTQLQNDKLTVLITGGSQGSRTLNRAVQQSWPLWEQALGKNRIHLIHQTGRGAPQELAAGFAASGLAGETTEFISNMPDAFAQADLIVSRSGMGTVSEIAAAGKPSLLIPFPAAADDHQRKNAEMLADAGAALLIPDNEMTGERLVSEVARLATAPEKLRAMGQAARAFAKPNAARRAVEVLEEVGNLRKNPLTD